MVLTRSGRNRLVALGLGESAIMNMENVLTTTSTMTVTAPTATVANAPAVSTSAVVMTPAVQPYVANAGNMSGGSRESVTSVSTPDYSSITARDDVQRLDRATPVQRPSQHEGGGPNGDVVGALRDEFSRHMDEFRRSLQEIARAVTQQAGQATTFNYNAPAPTPLRPMAETNYFNEVPVNNTYAQHFRPVRAPQYAQNFGSNEPPCNFPLDYPSPSGNRVDLSKWGLKFDGTSKSMSAEDFMFRVDVLRQDYNCSFNDVLRSFHLLLEGQALDWYWNVRKLTPLRTWQDLEAAFLTQYRRFESEFQVQKKIMDRRQMPQESFEDFYNAIIRLRNQQRSPYSEADLVEIMRSNLRPALSHLLFSVRISSLNEFCQQAKRAEGLLNSQRPQYQQRNFQAQRVNELAYEEDSLTNTSAEVEALATNSRYTCWNCRQGGHSFVDCPSTTRRIFCFRCGRDGVVTPKCPKCQGNLAVNKSLPGQTRSTQT